MLFGDFNYFSEICIEISLHAELSPHHNKENYTRWWINGGYDFAELVDSQWEYRGYVHATSSDGEQACTYDILEGSWYHVMVPDKGKSNTIIITVDPLSGDGNPREAIIEMQAGDAFTKISIAQQ